MAGSAKVTPMPSRKAIASTKGSVSFLGRLWPITSLKGMRPSLSPSMKSIRPRMTATKPAVMRVASDTA